MKADFTIIGKLVDIHFPYIYAALTGQYKIQTSVTETKFI